MRRALALAVATGLLLVGCGGREATTGQFLAARRAAGIADCPPTTDAPARADGLPDLVLECLGESSQVRLAGLRGEPLLIVFWAQWCQPCRSEMSMLGRVLPSYAGRLRVLLVATNETRYELAVEFAQSTGVTAPQAVDPDMAALGPLGLPRAIPQSVLVAPDGRVVHRHSGGWDEPTLRAALADHLQVAP